MENQGNKFLNTQYGDLASSKEVKRAAMAAGNEKLGDRDARIQRYLERLERIIARERVGGKKGESLLEKMLVSEMVLDVDDEELVLKLTKSLYESEKRIATERGQGADVERYELEDGELLEKYKGAILEKAEIQKQTLGAWFTYLKQNDANYPTWFRYYVVRSLMDMGQFSRDDVTYTNRTETTIAPFPEFNAASLAFVKKSIDVDLEAESIPPEIEDTIVRDTKLDEAAIAKIATLKEEFQYNATQAALKNARARARTEYVESKREEKRKAYIEDTPFNEERQEELTEELLKRLSSKKFAELYAFAQVETAGNLDRESLVGEWVKYDKGSDYRLLEKGLKGKGTGWCTAEGSARGQIEAGDFYVYYTMSKAGVPTEPRIAVRMQDDQIAEIRGVDPRQELEPVLVDTARDFYKNLPGAGKYEKATADMKQMTALYNKSFVIDKDTQEKRYLSPVLTKEELRFLYEVEGEIEGFGYEKDPRIEEVTKKRERNQDIKMLCDCEPQHIAHTFSDIREQIQVYVEDDGEKITLVDFREENNKGKLTQILELAKRIQEIGSSARPDISCLGGIVHASIPPEFMKDRETAFKKFKEADSIPDYIWPKWANVPFTTPEKTDIDFVVFSYNEDPNTRRSSEMIVADIEKLGYRPPTLEEMILAGIAEPKLTKTSGKYFVGLTPYQVVGGAHVPVLFRNGDKRDLGGSRWTFEWRSYSRFLAVRK